MQDRVVLEIAVKPADSDVLLPRGVAVNEAIVERSAPATRSASPSTSPA